MNSSILPIRGSLLWLMLVFSIVLINTSSFAQGSTSTHNVSFQTPDGIYGHVVLKAAPRSMGESYIVLDVQEVVFEGVSGSTPSGISFPLRSTKFTVDVSGSGCMRLNSQTPDCGSFSKRYLGRSSDYTTVNFSRNARDKHNEIRKETGVETWISSGFVQNLEIKAVRGSDLNNIRSAMNSSTTEKSAAASGSENNSSEQSRGEGTGEEDSSEEETVGQESAAVTNQQNIEAEQQSRAQREEDRRRREQEQKRRKQQEYDNWKSQAEQRNQALAASSVASSSAFLYLVGGMIYGNMGQVMPDKVYRGSNFYLGIDFGYSSSFTPIFFNSDYETMSGGNTHGSQKVKASYGFTVNFDMKVKAGYEQENAGGYAYYYPQAGFSPLFDTYSLSYKRFGGQIFGGIENLKAYYDYTQGDRYMYTFNYLDVEEYGDGKMNHNYRRNELGLRISYNSFIRNHIYLGLIYDNVLTRPSGAKDYSYVQNIKGKSGGSLVPRSEVEDQIVTGYTFRLQKDQHYNFYVNLFPEYPFTGDIRFGIDSDFNDGEPGFFIEVGFTRSLDSWF